MMEEIEITGKPDPYAGDPVGAGLIPPVSAGKALVRAVEQKLLEEYSWGREKPPGLTLLMHPHTKRLVFMARDLAMYNQETLFSVPVKVTTDGLEPGQYKLAIITEVVLLGGKLAD
jgi:hypothetical protein